LWKVSLRYLEYGMLMKSDQVLTDTSLSYCELARNGATSNYRTKVLQLLDSKQAIQQ